MALTFLTANSRLERAQTFAYPMTFGMWVWWGGAATESYWASGDSTGTLLKQFTIGASGSSWCISANNVLATAGACVSSNWTFLLARLVSATNRWMASLDTNGVTVGQATTSQSFSVTADYQAIGTAKISTSSFSGPCTNGKMGEFWYTGTDVQPDGLTTQPDLVRQLAFGGPFSIPSVAKDLLEYRSFRVDPLNPTGPPDTYFGDGVPKLWTNTGPVAIGPHPPLPYWYRRPTEDVPALGIV